MIRIGILILFSLILPLAAAPAQLCVNCHTVVTPRIVDDWKLSRHSRSGVDCSACHGDQHMSAATADKALIPTPETCAACHEQQVEQYKNSKHAVAWVAMNAMPYAHAQPMALVSGMKGCGGCHKIGLKSEAERKERKANGRGFGDASCDACHTRHTFSALEAKQPQACQTCHMGFDHPQWEMYSSSKHGVRYLLAQNRLMPDSAAAPTCQTCHMQGGDHGVITPWGFLAVRLPLPEDKDWAADRTVILQALGVLDPDGKPTARLDVVKAGKVARLTQEEWQTGREKMLKVCGQCHAPSFAQEELEKGDALIRQADHAMAEAIRIVADLYRSGALRKPKEYAYAFPDLLTFHDAPTSIEQDLFVMFLENRSRAFQGAFHMNPDYALWYGWSDMQRRLTEIRERAAELRAEKR